MSMHVSLTNENSEDASGLGGNMAKLLWYVLQLPYYIAQVRMLLLYSLYRSDLSFCIVGAAWETIATKLAFLEMLYL